MSITLSEKKKISNIQFYARFIKLKFVTFEMLKLISDLVIHDAVILSQLLKFIFRVMVKMM